MNFTPLILAAALVATGCATASVEVPLQGVHVLRPSAARKKIGARVGLGIEQGSELQGTVGEVRDPDGDVVNEVVDYRPAEGGAPLSNSDTSFVGELGLAFLERFDVGYSTTRGAYLFANVVDTPFFALALTPQYSKSTATSRDRESSLGEGEKKFTTTVEHAGVTAIASLYLGDRKSFGPSVYAGYGYHRYTLSLKDHRSGEAAAGTGDTLATLVGFGIETFFGSVHFETALAQLKQRDETTPASLTLGCGASFSFGD